MDVQKNKEYVDNLWDLSILPALMRYIKIPNKSPQFDPQWQEHGFMDQAIKLIADWCKAEAIPGMTLDVVKLEQRTPVIFIEIPGDSAETVLLYGHLDKQPEMTGWDEDLHPWQPVLRDNKLYGRGGADDGYAVFASLAAIKSLHAQNLPHARCVILIEACEESGSYDLPFYIDALQNRIGDPSLIVCLDSGCANYNQLWLTTSLRGLVGGTLTIQVLKEGIHSGQGSGVVPSCFRIFELLLSRIEDMETGNINLKGLHVQIPTQRESQAAKTAAILGNDFYHELPFKHDVQPESKTTQELILRRTWLPALSITGCTGLPAIEDAGNVTLPSLSFKLSMRLPPTCDHEEAAKQLKSILEEDPPYHAKIVFTIDDTGPGWNAPQEAPWLLQSINKASLDYFGQEAGYIGEGGSIPFMGMLGKKFPNAQFLITGVLGPQSNAHGPNEFLHIPMGKKLTASVAQIIADHFNRKNLSY